MSRMEPEVKELSFQRCVRGSCPECGEGKLMLSWFQVNDQCDRCSHVFPVKEGSFLGSIAINYGIVVFLFFPLWLLIWKWLSLEMNWLLYGGIFLSVVGPFAIYPFAWRLWLWLCFRFLNDVE